MNELESMTIDDLFALRDRIAEVLESRRSDLQRQIDRISGKTSAPTAKLKAIVPGPIAVSKKIAKAGKSVKAMYRHPKTGETWSGRGRPARWLATEIAAGKSKEDFRIA